MNNPIVDSIYYIVKANMPLVYRIVSHFEDEGIEREKLIKAGLNGLIKAAIRFNLYEKLSFQTFCTPYIIQNVSRVYKEISLDNNLRIDEKEHFLSKKEDASRKLIENIIISNYKMVDKIKTEIATNLAVISKK